MTVGELQRLSAFTDEPAGGNPAGVWIGDHLPPAAEMQRIAAEVGYSETAFLAPAARGAWTTRYYSPLAEVPFCGHATIAAGGALFTRAGRGTYDLETTVGTVPVEVDLDPRSGLARATLTSVDTDQRELPSEVLSRALDLLGWTEADLDPALPPALAFAGAWHLVVPLADRQTLAALAYDFDGLGALMEEHELTTVQVVWREDLHTFHARDPFPVGGVVEDPATGAAAAALGGYLRARSFVTPPVDVVIHQGHDMGRPSRLDVHIPESGGIRVTGTAVAL